MANRNAFAHKVKDGLELQCFSWETPGVDTKAVVLLMHGMTEYVLRYDEYASFLSDNGVMVFAFDMRGHGKTSPDPKDRGYFADDGGAQLLASDLLSFQTRVIEILSEKGLAHVPLILYGHSMGSLIVLKALAMNKGRFFDGLVLSGLPECPAATNAGLLLAKMQTRLIGPRAEGKFLTNLAFGPYNKRIAKPRTVKDWLTRDEGIVDKYVADPDCMFLFKTAGYVGLLDLTKHSVAKNLTDDLDPALAVLFIGGEEDPCGGYGKAPRLLAERMRAHGHETTLKLYPGGRHEMHNEINRIDVYRDALSFILQASQRKKVLRGALASGPGDKDL